MITDDEELAALCRAYRNCGRFGGAREPVLGWDFRLTEFQAGLLLSQMNRLEEQTRLRDENGRYLAEQLRTVPGIRPLKRLELDSVERHTYHLSSSVSPPRNGASPSTYSSKRWRPKGTRARGGTYRCTGIRCS